MNSLCHRAHIHSCKEKKDSVELREKDFIPKSLTVVTILTARNCIGSLCML